MTSKRLFKKTFHLRRSRVANFFDIIEIATIFIKKTFKESNKFKRIINYVLKGNLYLYSLIWQKLISILKCWCQQNKRSVSRDLYILLDLLEVRYNCANIHHYRICVIDFRKAKPFFHLLICEQPRKGTSWIRLKELKVRLSILKKLA